MRNIVVVDSSGKNYAPTYPRRARGLIKAGRARWSDNRKKKICLLVSPAHYEEDNTMNERYDNDGNIIATDSVVIAETPNESDTQLTIGYILSQMEKIRSDSEYIHRALEDVQKINPHEPSVSGAQDIGSQAMAHAINGIVTSREATNQKLLAMYERMYEDIKPTKQNANAYDIEKLLGYASTMTSADQTGNFGHSFGSKLGDLLNQMFEQ